ncbi:MAG: FecR domain-containing protein [Spirochaetales bacterium]|nr:FecR domain-containing protein [Spirochaetales bacterium]
MRRTAAVLILATVIVSSLAAQSNPLIIYSEGEALVQDAKGGRRSAAIGTFVYVDETLITGRGGRIQLQSRDGVFDMSENTAFKLMQAQTKGKKQNAYVVALGRVSMKMRKVAAGGTPPRLGSTTAAAGVKGTELDVYEGADGSSLILVTEGEVEVESQGKTVTLAANEGVEVTPGRAPGAKYTFSEFIDYSKWNQNKLEEMMKDPVGSLKLVEAELNGYMKKIETMDVEYKEKIEWFKNEFSKLDEIEKTQGKEARYKRYHEISPIGNEASYLAIDIRFQTIMALSLRRFVLGRMYFFIKLKYINNYSDKTYIAFMTEYRSILQTFTTVTQSHVVDQDI